MLFFLQYFQIVFSRVFCDGSFVRRIHVSLDDSSVAQKKGFAFPAAVVHGSPYQEGMFFILRSPSDIDSDFQPLTLFPGVLRLQMRCHSVPIVELSS